MEAAEGEQQAPDACDPALAGPLSAELAAPVGAADAVPSSAEPTVPEPRSNTELAPPMAPAGDAAAVIKLVGAKAFIEALHDAGSDRAIFHGFRSGVKTLDNPVIQRRLAQALEQTRVQEALSIRWARDSGPLYVALDSVPAAADLQRLVLKYGVPVMEWALFLHPNEDVRRLSLAEYGGALPSAGHPDDLPPERKDDGEGARETVSAETRSICSPGVSQSLDEGESRRDTVDIRLAAKRGELLAARKKVEALEREVAQLKHRIQEDAKKTEELARRSEHAESEARSAARQVTRLQKSLEEAAAKTAAAERALRRAVSKGSSPGSVQTGSVQTGSVQTGSVQTVSVQTGSEPALLSASPEGRTSNKPSSTKTALRGPAARAEGSDERVVLRLIEHGRHEAVIEYANAFLDLEPGSEKARKWLLDALLASGRREDAARLYYETASRALADGSRREALRALRESICVSPESPDVGWRLEKIIQTADPASSSDVEQVAVLYASLKQISPPAANAFETLARRLRRSLWRRLPAASAMVNRTLSIEWPGPSGAVTTSASELAAAVKSGDSELVMRFRKWAAAQHGEVRQQALQIIEGANTHVPGARRVLTGATRPVLVDGSNVAWFGCSQDSGPDPENIRVVRQTLFAHGYFPVTVFADAALPYQVKDLEVIHRWELRGEIVLVEGNTDADEALVLEARRAGVPIVTNDRLRDVDPEERCARIGFSIGVGSVTLIE